MLSFNWTPREKKLLIACIVIALIALGVMFLPNHSDHKQMMESQDHLPPLAEKKTSVSQPAPNVQVVVDLKGAVKKPGIYRVDSTARVFDVLELAGGPLQEADLNQVNLAQMLSDGMVVYIPKKGETVPVVNQMAGSGLTTTESKININLATAEELLQLEGIGPAKAKAIIQYREKNGPFRSIDDLANVSGIGEKTLAKFRDQVAIN
jgi:competence protein ComEA